MTIERLEELKPFITSSQSVIREASNLPEFRAKVDKDAQDVLYLIHEESERQIPCYFCGNGTNWDFGENYCMTCGRKRVDE